MSDKEKQGVIEMDEKTFREEREMFIRAFHEWKEGVE